MKASLALHWPSPAHARHSDGLAQRSTGGAWPAGSCSSSSSSAAAAAAPARAADLLASRAADATDAIALIEPSTSTRWSYGELNDRALAFARGLDEMGYVPGAKLGVRLDNCNELLIAMLGASARGIDVETAKTMDALARDVRCRGTLVHHLDAAAAGAMPGAHEPIAIRGGAVSDPIVHWDIMIDAFRGWDAPMPPVREREGGGGGGGGSGGDGDDGRTTSSSFFFNAPGKPTREAALLAHGVAAAQCCYVLAELPLESQAKLLRALESGEVRRVGSAKVEYPEVRIVAATNRDLQVEVEQGRFRSDLYYRLAVLAVRITPLRDRPEDLKPLAEVLCRRLGRGVKLTPAAPGALVEDLVRAIVA